MKLMYLFRRDNNIYYTTTYDNQKLFIKRYPATYSASRLTEEFRKAKIIYSVLKNQKQIGFSRPIFLDLPNKLIAFEYICNAINLMDMLDNKQIPDSSFNSIFYNIGHALSKIHKHLNKNSQIKTNSDNIVCYGDLAVNNILISNNKLFFIDCGPLGNEPVFIKKPVIFDLIRFIQTVNNRPFFKLIRMMRRNTLALEYHFLEGYLAGMNISFDYELYLKEKSKTCLFNNSEYLRKAKLTMNVKYLLKYFVCLLLQRKIIPYASDSYDYRCDYMDGTKAHFYDSSYDRRDNFYTLIWNLFEKKCLLHIVNRLQNRTTYLDFAAGSGRVLKELESLFQKSCGVDISPQMIALARTHIKKSKIYCADITKNIPPELNKKFECITAFRFFLNANPSLRLAAIFHLSRLMADEGILIFNVHGNKWSFYYLYALFYRFFYNRAVHCLSERDVESILAYGGLHIVATFGHGFIPPIFCRIFGRKLYYYTDRLFQKIFFGYLTMNRIYIAKKIKWK